MDNVIKYETAKKIIKFICDDNGIQPYPLPETSRNISLLDSIANCLESFVELNPDFILTDDVLEEMAVGEQNEADEKYSSMQGYEALSEAMNNFFEMYDDGIDWDSTTNDQLSW